MSSRDRKQIWIHNLTHINFYVTLQIGITLILQLRSTCLHKKPKLIKIQQQSLTFMLNINQSINSTVTLTIALSFVSCENLRTKS